MCDYSLHNVRSRPAKVGDKLTIRDFGTCTRGFAAAEDAGVAVCVLPGTELAFSSPVTLTDYRFIVGWKVEILSHATAIFRQVNKNEPRKHHDALEFPDGRIVLLTRLSEGQKATVLQLPAQPTTAAEAGAQRRIAYVALKIRDGSICVGCLMKLPTFVRYWALSGHATHCTECPLYPRKRTWLPRPNMSAYEPKRTSM